MLDTSIPIYQGEGLVLHWREKDDTGLFVNPNTHPRRFVIPELLLTIVPTPTVVSGVDMWFLTITPLQLAPVLSQGVDWYVYDDQNVVPLVVGAGKIYLKGVSL